MDAYANPTTTGGTAIEETDWRNQHHRVHQVSVEHNETPCASKEDCHGGRSTR
jgi:hypothetical protein